MYKRTYSYLLSRCLLLCLCLSWGHSSEFFKDKACIRPCRIPPCCPALFTLLPWASLPLPEQPHCPFTLLTILLTPPRPSPCSCLTPAINSSFQLACPKTQTLPLCSRWPGEEFPPHRHARSLRAPGLLQPAGFLTGFCHFELSSLWLGQFISEKQH